MEKRIKAIRVNIDKITQLSQNLDKSREVSLAITALQLSKMWLGKVLKELGAANPYPESRNPYNENIEPTSDVAKSLNDCFGDKWGDYNYEKFTHIQKVKWLRQEIEKVEYNIKFFRLALTPDRLHTVSSLEGYHESKTYCIEAGMWLGIELGRINNSK